MRGTNCFQKFYRRTSRDATGKDEQRGRGNDAREGEHESESALEGERHKEREQARPAEEGRGKGTKAVYFCSQLKHGYSDLSASACAVP